MKKILPRIFRLTAAAVQGQEKIDRLMDSFSTTGQAHYKSLVIREKQTKAIEKIIKTPEINNTLKANEFYQAFKNESKNAVFSENKQTTDNKSFTLIFQEETQSRIYILETGKSRMQVQVIITKNNPDKK